MKRLILIAICLLSAYYSRAQTHSVAGLKLSSITTPNPTFLSTNPAFKLPSSAFISTNRGYHDLAFLCRMELSIEKKLPFGVWMKVGSHRPLELEPQRRVAYPHFRLKLFEL